MNIIQAFAQQGFHVQGIEINDNMIKEGTKRVEKDLDKLVAKEKMSAQEKEAVINRIYMTTDFNSVEDAEVVVEAVFEDIQVKKDLFKKLDTIVEAQDALLLTNTSSLSISEIAAATDRPENVAGMHFFNPVPLMKLVEVVRCVESSDDTIAKVADLVKLMGKVPVVCKDSPGFVVNRMMHALILEAARIVEENVADARDVDTAAKLGLGHPMGPFEVVDFLDGVHLFRTASEYLTQELGSRFKVPVWVKNYDRSGRTGRSSGKGFHDYTKE